MGQRTRQAAKRLSHVRTKRHCLAECIAASKAALVFTSGVVIAGCATPVMQPNLQAFSPVSVATAGNEGIFPGHIEYQFQVGDTLDVKFFYNPGLNENAIVRPDGKISLQLVGEIAVAGLSPGESEKALVERYRSHLRRPELTVMVRKFSAQKIYVGGEVPAPGAIALEGKELTALGAILQSGGFKHSADRRQVLVLRNDGTGQPRFIRLDLDAHLSLAATADVPLKPFDIVYVPPTQISQIAQYFDEYISKIVPLYRNLGFSFTYNLRRDVQIKQ